MEQGRVARHNPTIKPEALWKRMMLKIMAATTLSAICRDLWPVSAVFRWLAPLLGAR
jgi:hypothetical protein